MTRLEAAEMRFLGSVTGYTTLDKIRSEVIRKELEISGIQDVRLKYKQNWIKHLERMDNTRLPKHALNCKPRRRRDRGRPRKRWQCIDAGSNDLIHGGRWWWWWWWWFFTAAICTNIYIRIVQFHLCHSVNIYSKCLREHFCNLSLYTLYTLSVQ